MAKKHSNAPVLIMIIGFVIGILIGRGLEWDFDMDDDGDEAQ